MAPGPPPVRPAAAGGTDDGGPPVLRGERVVLRPAGPGDWEAIAALLAQPSVAQWWGNVDPAAGLAWLGDDAVPFVLEPAGEPGRVAGAIVYSEETDPDYRHAAIDLFLGEEHQGRGLGPDALRTLARYLFEDRGHHRITIDPAAANDRAVRAYARVGFRPVGIMRRYERGPDGVWRDGLLMDLLRDELA